MNLSLNFWDNKKGATIVSILISGNLRADDILTRKLNCVLRAIAKISFLENITRAYFNYV